ncbi:NACHT, LRR and PYD domains-containing protein 2 [Echinops telfairi]|uniref:NACHT, LRR and PYD domains-containing protein 2 n=1 Tax=Echinops telfairi TaxID=9371 RepID=A0AC55D9A4_ECHTE|nr:NACHT, LRR and PYD domains-containing protein 2 [Echinops telfairi]
MASVGQVNLDLAALLEELNQKELGQFKTLLKSLPQQSVFHSQELPTMEGIDEANGRQLAETMVQHCRRFWVDTMSLLLFNKSNQTDLHERVANERWEAAGRSFIAISPSASTETIGALEPQDSKSEETNTAGEQGHGDEYIPILKKLFVKIWENNFYPGAIENFPLVCQRYATMVPFYSPETLAGPLPYTVVLRGPAGVGKSTLAKKLMMDWAEDRLEETFQYVFYLNCRELRKMGPCSYAQLMSKCYPELKDNIPAVIAEAHNVLFVIDGFNELRFPPGALLRDVTGNWKKQKPVPILLSSLLKKMLLPNVTLLITTQPWMLRELRSLLEEPLFIDVEGYLEVDKSAYFLEHFQDGEQAQKAFNLLKSNPALCSLASAPAVCWLVCTCLKLQMDHGQDPAPTCQTVTSLFFRFLCNQFTLVPTSDHLEGLGAVLKTLCLLAAEGVWTQGSVFGVEDLERLGAKEFEISPFLERNILRKDRDCGGCYSFIHLSVQQFFAALFYVLGREGEEGKAERVRELETTFGCQVPTDYKRALLKRKVKASGNKPLSVRRTREMFCCLYESQEEAFIKEAMAYFKEISLTLQDKMDMVRASSCLKHSSSVERMSLKIEKGLFLEDGCPELDSLKEDPHILPLWVDLCSILGSSKNLVSLDLSNCYLNESAVRVFCDQITSTSHSLQKVSLNHIFPSDAYQDFCFALVGQKTLAHLTLQGSTHNEMLPLLYEGLKHPECNLQYLSLESCSTTFDQLADIFFILKINQSLTCLSLTDIELLDEGMASLCDTLEHLECSLQKLSLEKCLLTKACCKDLSSALVNNQKLTHLCLAKNDLGDDGVTLLCEGLSSPKCRLQTLVLWDCGITDEGCSHLSKLLQQKSCLTQLDLGMNRIGFTGLNLLCEALKEPTCSLKCLWLKIDKSDTATQKLLDEVKKSNPQLTIEQDNHEPRRNRFSCPEFLF